jgi:osmotically-inducible protein OsmY
VDDPRATNVAKTAKGAQAQKDEPVAGVARTEEAPYESQRISDALAQDSRVGELGLEVHVGDDWVSVSGEVTTEARRSAIGVVVEEVLPGSVVHNNVTVVPVGPPDIERVP